MRRLPLLAALLALVAGSGAWAGPVPGATACPVFPRDNVWHADVSRLPVHARSAAWLSSSGASTRRLHPDFGRSGDPAVPYGIPVHVVGSAHSKVYPEFEYADESDRGPYPLDEDTPIEGGSDRHTVVVDRDSCTLYETWATERTPSGWTAGSGAIWNLKSNALRPAGWTSADAAGLPILPGLLRWDEVRAGVVDHAIRFTVARTDESYVWPARHEAGSVRDPNVPPMGARFRLKASFDVSRYGAVTRVVLAAMKTYGLMLADNGSDWFFTGAASNDWPDALIAELKSVPASAFEAVDTASLMVSRDSGAARGSVRPPRRPGNTYRPYSPAPTRRPAASTAPPRTPPPSTPPPSTPPSSPVRSPGPTASPPTGLSAPVPGSAPAAPRGRRAASGPLRHVWWAPFAVLLAGTAFAVGRSRFRRD